LAVSGEKAINFSSARRFWINLCSVFWKTSKCSEDELTDDQRVFVSPLSEETEERQDVAQEDKQPYFKKEDKQRRTREE
jgi:hypothetical protein